MLRKGSTLALALALFVSIVALGTSAAMREVLLEPQEALNRADAIVVVVVRHEEVLYSQSGVTNVKYTVEVQETLKGSVKPGTEFVYIPVSWVKELPIPSGFLPGEISLFLLLNRRKSCGWVAAMTSNFVGIVDDGRVTSLYQGKIKEDQLTGELWVVDDYVLAYDAFYQRRKAMTIARVYVLGACIGVFTVLSGYWWYQRCRLRDQVTSSPH